MEDGSGKMGAGRWRNSKFQKLNSKPARRRRVASRRTARFLDGIPKREDGRWKMGENSKKEIPNSKFQTPNSKLGLIPKSRNEN
jgi:hypothetical protein